MLWAASPAMSGMLAGTTATRLTRQNPGPSSGVPTVSISYGSASQKARTYAYQIVRVLACPVDFPQGGLEPVDHLAPFR